MRSWRWRAGPLNMGKPAGKGTATLPGASIVCLPLQSGTHTLGVLAFHNTPSRYWNWINGRS